MAFVKRLILTKLFTVEKKIKNERPKLLTACARWICKHILNSKYFKIYTSILILRVIPCSDNFTLCIFTVFS